MHYYFFFFLINDNFTILSITHISTNICKKCTSMYFVYKIRRKKCSTFFLENRSIALERLNCIKAYDASMHRCSQRRKRKTEDKSKKYDIINLMRKNYSFLCSRQESTTFRGILLKKIKYSIWIAN